MSRNRLIAVTIISPTLGSSCFFTTDFLESFATFRTFKGISSSSSSLKSSNSSTDSSSDEEAYLGFLPLSLPLARDPCPAFFFFLLPPLALLFSFLATLFLLAGVFFFCFAWSKSLSASSSISPASVKSTSLSSLYTALTGCSTLDFLLFPFSTLLALCLFLGGEEIFRLLADSSSLLILIASSSDSSASA